MKQFFALILLLGATAVSAVPVPVDDVIDFEGLDALASRCRHLSLGWERQEAYQGQEISLPAFALKVEGGNLDTIYNLVARNLDETVTIERACRLDVSGMVRTADDPDSLLVLVFGGFAPGQPIDYYLLSADNQHCCSTHLVPRPLEASDECGYSLSVELTPDVNQLFRVRGHGFKPGEEVLVTSHTFQGERTKRMTASRTGTVNILLLPGLVSDEGGNVNLALSGDKGNVDIRFPWGEDFDAWTEELAAGEESAELVVERLRQPLSPVDEPMERELVAESTPAETPTVDLSQEL